MTQSIADQLNEAQARRERNGHWVAACGGSETPMTVRGVRVLYCWHTGTREHAYINLGTDMVMSAAEATALGL